MRLPNKNPQWRLFFNRQKLTSEQGFTLIETMIALVILMISVSGIASVITYAISYNSGAASRELALTIAQQQMEQLRSVSFTDASLNETSGTSTFRTSAGQTFNVVKTIVYTPSASPTLKTITIQVTPLDPNYRWARTGISISGQRALNKMGTN